MEYSLEEAHSIQDILGHYHPFAKYPSPLKANIDFLVAFSSIFDSVIATFWRSDDKARVCEIV